MELVGRCVGLGVRSCPCGVGRAGCTNVCIRVRACDAVDMSEWMMFKLQNYNIDLISGYYFSNPVSMKYSLYWSLFIICIIFFEFVNDIL